MIKNGAGSLFNGVMNNKAQRVAPCLLVAFLGLHGLHAEEREEDRFGLSKLPTIEKKLAIGDWLVDDSPYVARIGRAPEQPHLVLDNGLVRREIRIDGNAATVSLENLTTGESLLRSVLPEAELVLDGKTISIGGLVGQKNHAFLTHDWMEKLQSDPAAYRLIGFELGEPKERFRWKRVRHHDESLAWPPAGKYLRMDYAPPEMTASRLDETSGRALLLADPVDTASSDWKRHESKAHERSSFENEGKFGEIFTPANTAVWAERKLPDGAAMVSVDVNPGDDRSSGWGPGIALMGAEGEWVQLRLHSGGKRLGLLHDGTEKKLRPGKGIKMGEPVTLRMHWDQDQMVAEVAGKNGVFQRLAQFKHGFKTMPQRVRIGKMDSEGGSVDGKKPGSLVRLTLKNLKVHGPVDAQARQMALSSPSQEIKVSVHYEIYDHVPVISKWITVENQSGKAVEIDRFTSELLAVVERGEAGGVAQELRHLIERPKSLWVETDYAMGSFHAWAAQKFSLKWVADKRFHTQACFKPVQRALLRVEPEYGPDVILPSGETFESYRAFELPLDSEDRERGGLARRRLYRTLAPWVTENPLILHLRTTKEDVVKKAIDQAAECGFEMVSFSFRSGLNMENESDENLAKFKRFTDYAESKGIQLGGYSLLSSRSAGKGNNVVPPEGTKVRFGRSPALMSEWGQNYFRKLKKFYQRTGFMQFTHDGSYPGNVDVTPRPPLQRGLNDSRWHQFATIRDFYRWQRGEGVILRVPDYYYLNGQSTCGMGYREHNWSLPREQQLIHTRQNIWDGTWNKMPTMGWMFVPLTMYHGGGAAATIEPLSEHIDHYQRMMQANLGLGVQAVYRGSRLYDTQEVKEMVVRNVNWFKKHRGILESDLIHGKRANGREIDWMLHVNPKLDHRAMLVVYNPKDEAVTQTIKVPLYYSGLTDSTMVSVGGDAPLKRELARDFSLEVEVEVPAGGMQWVLFEAP